MPSEMIPEQIMQAVITQLKTISSGTTYWNTINDDNITQYVRTIDEINSAVNPFLQVLMGDIDFDHLVQQHRDMGQMPVTIIGVYKSDRREELAKYNRRLIRDVIVALLANVSLGGLCHTVHIKGVATDEGMLAYDDYAMFELSLMIDYQFSWTNP